MLFSCVHIRSNLAQGIQASEHLQEAAGGAEKASFDLVSYLRSLRPPVKTAWFGLRWLRLCRARRSADSWEKISPMHLMHLRLLSLLLLSFTLGNAAETDARLQELLKRYPEADTNKDGVLSFEEAQAHAKVIRRGKKGDAQQTTNDDGSAPPPSTTRKPAPTFAD